MKASASAPGKAFLVGEYAVLHGAPALVAALDRRAIATVTTAPHWSVSAVFGGARVEAGLDRGADGRPCWPANVPERVRRQLRLVDAVLDTLPGAGTGDQDACAAITLDTSAFYEDGTKLGLGSSAAATVALAGALATWQRQPTPTLASLVALHRSFQGGRGSGADIAAARHGGVVRVQGGPQPAGSAGTTPTVTATALPADLAMAFFWSGRAADTRDYLDTLSAWRAREPDRAAQTMQHLQSVARRGWTDAAGLVDVVGAYSAALDDLDRASGLGIFAGAHATLRDLAAGGAVAYKPCGAGGGDLGVAMATSERALLDFAGKADAAGIQRLDLLVDDAGLDIRTDAGIDAR